MRPGLGREIFYLPVGGKGQPGENVVQIGVRIESTTAAAFDDGVEDGAAFPGLGFARVAILLLKDSFGFFGSTLFFPFNSGLLIHCLPCAPAI